MLADIGAYLLIVKFNGPCIIVTVIRAERISEHADGCWFMITEVFCRLHSFANWRKESSTRAGIRMLQFSAIMLLTTLSNHCSLSEVQLFALDNFGGQGSETGLKFDADVATAFFERRSFFLHSAIVIYSEAQFIMHGGATSAKKKLQVHAQSVVETVKET
jgi:hypothetical protein